MTARILRPDTAFSLSTGKRKRPRVEAGAHLKWIRTLPCLVTGKRAWVEAAHIRYADHGAGKREVGKGEKPDDKWAIPLSAKEHRAQHDTNERLYWAGKGINPIETALRLWAASGDDEAAEIIIRQARTAVKAEDRR